MDGLAVEVDGRGRDGVDGAARRLLDRHGPRRRGNQLVRRPPTRCRRWTRCSRTPRPSRTSWSTCARRSRTTRIPGFVVREVDGSWYFSPMATATEQLLAVVRALTSRGDRRAAVELRRTSSKRSRRSRSSEVAPLDDEADVRRRATRAGASRRRRRRRRASRSSSPAASSPRKRRAVVPALLRVRPRRGRVGTVSTTRSRTPSSWRPSRRRRRASRSWWRRVRPTSRRADRGAQAGVPARPQLVHRDRRGVPRTSSRSAPSADFAPSGRVSCLGGILPGIRDRSAQMSGFSRPGRPRPCRGSPRRRRRGASRSHRCRRRRRTPAGRGC